MNMLPRNRHEHIERIQQTVEEIHAGASLRWRKRLLPISAIRLVPTQATKMTRNAHQDFLQGAVASSQLTFLWLNELVSDRIPDNCCR